MEIFRLVQPDAVCVYALGDYCVSGEKQEELLYRTAAGIADDPCMFNLHLHRSGRTVAFEGNLLYHRRRLHDDGTRLVHDMVQEGLEVGPPGDYILLFFSFELRCSTSKVF